MYVYDDDDNGNDVDIDVGVSVIDRFTLATLEWIQHKIINKKRKHKKLPTIQQLVTQHHILCCLLMHIVSLIM